MIEVMGGGKSSQRGGKSKVLLRDYGFRDRLVKGGEGRKHSDVSKQTKRGNRYGRGKKGRTKKKKSPTSLKTLPTSVQAKKRNQRSTTRSGNGPGANG